MRCDLRFATLATPVGQVLAVRSPRGVCSLTFVDALASFPPELTARLRRRWPDLVCQQDSDAFDDLQCVLEDWFFSPQSAAARVCPLLADDASAGESSDPLVVSSAQSLPLDPGGTPFQQRIWHLLQTLSRGESVSYGDLARRAGMPNGARAVASACAANPIALLIPCHRVIGQSGRLTGYRWGIERKAQLLAMEQSEGAAG